MKSYEYKVVPAPTKGTKAKGIKTPEARFSLSIETLLNKVAADGWEYLRAETLPSVERAGIASSTTEWRNVLIFRRPVSDVEVEPEVVRELLPSPEAVAPVAAVALGGVTRDTETPESDVTPIAQPNADDSAEAEIADAEETSADAKTDDPVSTEDDSSSDQEKSENSDSKT